MTGLLVSVRDADEAQDAVDSGADLIDVKEPRAGSLGAATPQTIAAVIDAVAGRRPVSVALGELIDFTPSAMGFAEVEAPPTRPIQFAKVGLAGCLGRNAWKSDWQRALVHLSSDIRAVAVVYADWRRAEAPPPNEVIETGRQLGCRAMLVDTFDKRGPGLLGVWSLEDIKRTIEVAKNAGMVVVLGGQIGEPHLPQLLALCPDYIAVRGAVCQGDRGGRLDPNRVRELKEALSEQ